MAIASLPDSQRSIFDTLVLINWRHSAEMLQAVREAKRGQDQTASAEATIRQWDFDYLASNGDDFDFLASMADEIDFLGSAAKNTIITRYNWDRTNSVESYVDLFRFAAQGEALNTQSQFWSLLSFVGINNNPSCILPDTFLPNTKLIQIHELMPEVDFTAYDDRYRQLDVIWVAPRFWNKISETIGCGEAFNSSIDLLKLVRNSLLLKVRVRTRLRVTVSAFAPGITASTHMWVHSFVLWTGISPPAEAPDVDIVDVRYAQGLNASEEYRDFLCRQTNRGRCARTHRSRCSGRNRRAGCPTNRHLGSCRNLGRGALRRSWPNRQDAPHQAA